MCSYIYIKWTVLENKCICNDSSNNNKHNHHHNNNNYAVYFKPVGFIAWKSKENVGGGYTMMKISGFRVRQLTFHVRPVLPMTWMFSCCLSQCRRSSRSEILDLIDLSIWLVLTAISTCRLYALPLSSGSAVTGSNIPDSWAAWFTSPCSALHSGESRP